MWAMMSYLCAFAVLALDGTTLAPHASFGAGLAVVVALVCWCIFDAWKKPPWGSGGSRARSLSERVWQALIGHTSAWMTRTPLIMLTSDWPGQTGSTHTENTTRASVALPGGVVPPKELHQRRWEWLMLRARRAPAAGAGAQEIPLATIPPRNTGAAHS
jgi:hypothetical protein